MGVCDSTNDPNKNMVNNVYDSANKNLGGNANALRSQKSLVLNNDVIVSDTNQNPETMYEKIKMLGEGSYGEVWLLRHKLTGKEYAMKIIEKSPYSNEKQIFNEINILKTLDHPNILKILEFHLEKNKFYIITDYCPEGELFSELEKKPNFTEKETSFLIYQILQAVNYCHNMRIVHRDIKPENIMITHRESNGLLHIKLIDFGTAKLFEKGNKHRAMVGSSYYIAPEVLKGKYDEECDLWSVGVIMYMLLCGVPPFNGEEEEEILRAVSRGKYDTSSEAYQKLSNNAKDLITKLLKFDPSERITAREALLHPWFETEEFQTIYRAHTIDPNNARKLMNNLEYYRSDNIIKCAVLAYLVHQNTNDKECISASYLFKDIDLNKNGKLSKEELTSAYVKYSGLSESQAAKKANAVFLNIDTDFNGFIESEEFIRACINPNMFTKPSYLQSAFKYFDLDGDGNISVNEVEAKFYQTSKNKNENTKALLKKMFDQIDINGDGFISFEEFSSMIKGVISS